MEEKNIWVVGGDRRQVYLANLLREDGHTVHTEGLEEGIRYLIAIAGAAVAFLPCVWYDRYARRNETLTYTVVREF